MLKQFFKKHNIPPLKPEEDEGEINSNWSVQRRGNK